MLFLALRMCWTKMAAMFHARVGHIMHAHLRYRFIKVAGGAAVRRIEAEVRRGALRAWPPLLNPLRGSGRPLIGE